MPHDRLSLLLDSGQQLDLQADDLVVFLDETGHEDYADRNYPLFDLGGCVTRVADYEKQVAAPWRALANSKR